MKNVEGVLVALRAQDIVYFLEKIILITKQALGYNQITNQMLELPEEHIDEIRKKGFNNMWEIQRLSNKNK